MVARGARLLVIDRSGSETAGTLVGVRPTALQLLVGNRAVEISGPEIAEIRRDGDSLWNGVLLGSAFGGAVALSFIGQVDCQTCGAWEAASVWLALSGGGAAVGGLLDHLQRDGRVAYRGGDREGSPRVLLSPLIAPGRRGLVMTRRF